MKRFILIFLFISIAQSHPPSDKAGSAAVIFLRGEISPRASSLGGAFTGLADGPSTIFYNPAGLVNIHDLQLSLNHTRWFQDIRMENLLFSYRLNWDFGIGFSLVHMWMPEIQGKDFLGNNTHRLNVSSTIATLGVAYKILPTVYAGFNIKYFQDQLAEYSAGGIAVDAGILVHTFIRNFTVGTSVQNIGGTVQYSNSHEELPLTYRMGAAYKLSRLNTIFTLDIEKNADTDFRLNAGVESKFADLLFLRLGNRAESINIFQPFIGVGIRIQQKYSLDYAFISNSDLGVVHRVGLSLLIPGPEKNYRKSAINVAMAGTILSPPEHIRYQILKNKLKITWKPIRGAQYNVYARLSRQDEWKKITRSPLYSNQILFKKPLHVDKMFIVMSSVINTEESGFSKEVEIHVH